ncbi:MAG: glycerophosphodiester phosphodiesterase [Salibacteraceae bacterium]
MNKIVVILLSSLAFFSCKKEEFNIVNLNGNSITAMGHGGMGITGNYPLNSYESVLNCLNLGMDGAEIDIQMTQDSVLVLFHDKDLSERTNLSGFINSMNWSELKTTNYISSPYQDYSIVSLDDLFNQISDLQNFKFTLDCKHYSENKNKSQLYQTYINAIEKILVKHKIESHVYIESQEVEFLTALKTQKPKYHLFIYPPTFESGLKTAIKLGLTGISIDTKKISQAEIQQAHENNLWVAIWGVKSKSDNIEAINKNPDIIQTDKAKHLIKLLKQ